jgi:hypothetical protein
VADRLCALTFLVVLVFTPLSQAQTLTTLCNLTGTSDDINPYGALVQGAEGNLYGTTSSEFGGGYGTRLKLQRKVR